MAEERGYMAEERGYMAEERGYMREERGYMPEEYRLLSYCYLVKKLARPPNLAELVSRAEILWT